MAAEPLLQVSGVSLSLQGSPVLQEVSFSLDQGEIVTIIGPNGAGKTTLIRVVLGALRPDAGTVRLRAGTRIGYVPQRLAVDETLPLTVERFVTLGGRAEARQVREVLAETGTDGLLGKPVQAVSGGEMQRVMLARALLRQPDLLVLDEPVQAVDVLGQYELYDLIAGLRHRHHCGILLVSHDLHLVMAATDRVLCLNHHVCCSGHPDSVSRDPSFLRLFGREGTRRLAVYHHEHDHRHDLHGQVRAEREPDA
jgi:zinc transport system ATP-binding protein